MRASSDIQRHKLEKVALAKRFSSSSGHASPDLSASVPATPDVPVVSEVQVVDEVRAAEEFNSREVDGAKPQYQDCMAMIRRSMLSTRRQAKLANLSAPEIVMHIASALRKHKVLSDEDVKFVKSTLPNQQGIVERVEAIRKHNAEMILSTASDFLQNLLMDRR